MARYVKLGTLGGYKDVPGGQSDPECTHVILTKKEYDQIYSEKAKAEREVSSPVIKCKKTPRKKCRIVAEVKGKR